jgi:hypothetical protein
MKRRDLIRRLEKHGCYLDREAAYDRSQSQQRPLRRRAASPRNQTFHGTRDLRTIGNSLA